MRTFIIYTCLFILSLSSSAQMFYFEFEGVERSYKVHLPPEYTPDSLYPLVFNLHGSGSNAIEQQLYCGFDFVADTAGIIVVYPNGVDNAWNIYGSSGVNDVGFISALIDTMASNYSIDLSRVYSTGMSMGGFMSYRLACELEYRIAAIASVTGLLVTNPCEPERPMPILQMHGTEDPIVPYTYVPITVSFWTIYNSCPEEPVITNLPDIDTTDNSTVTVSYYGYCEDSTEVILYTINGGGHTWPGALISIGVTNQDINGSVEIWDFFQRYTVYDPLKTPELTKNNATISIYPNPVAQVATIEVNNLNSLDFDIKIIDINGRTVKTIPGHGEKRLLFEREDLPQGIYFLELSGPALRASSKIILK